MEIQALLESIDRTLADLETDLIQQHDSVEVREAQRRCLEAEAEVCSREQRREDATEPRRRLAAMRGRVALLKEKAAAELDKRPRSLMISAVNDDVTATEMLQYIRVSIGPPTERSREKAEYCDRFLASDSGGRLRKSG